MPFMLAIPSITAIVGITVIVAIAAIWYPNRPTGSLRLATEEALKDQKEVIRNHFAVADPRVQEFFGHYARLLFNQEPPPVVPGQDSPVAVKTSEIVKWNVKFELGAEAAKFSGSFNGARP